MFTKTDETMMRFALDEARIAFQEGEIPVGAVVARGDQVISRAHNEREKSMDPTSHAEILALRAAAKQLGRWKLNGLTLYVTLEPCPMCAGAIAMSGIKNVVFGARDEQYGCAGSVYRLTEDPAFPTYCPSDGGLMEEECKLILDEFWKDTRNKAKNT